MSAQRCTNTATISAKLKLLGLEWYFSSDIHFLTKAAACCLSGAMSGRLRNISCTHSSIQSFERWTIESVTHLVSFSAPLGFSQLPIPERGKSVSEFLLFLTSWASLPSSQSAFLFPFFCFHFSCE